MSVYALQQPLPYFVGGDRFSRQFKDVPVVIPPATSFLSHVTVAAAANGTADHTIDPATTGTVVAGSAFTPTAGRLLVACVDGAVTSTTPSGWSIVAGGSSVGNTGLYVWYRTAAGGDTFTTTHNASNYAVAFDIYEFPATWSFHSSETAGAVANGAASPTLTGLTGTTWVAGVVGQANGGGGTQSFTWDAGVEAADTSSPAAGVDGYTYSLTYTEGNTAASVAFAATGTSAGSQERLVFAVTVA